MKNAVLLVILVAVAAGGGRGQDLHLGVKVGVPATTYFETREPQYSAATRRYTFGASAEWRLRGNFGLELDALYKRMGYVGNLTILQRPSLAVVTTSFDTKGSSWEFPLMAKYRFGRIVRPYVAAGGVLRYIGPVRARGTQTVGGGFGSVPNGTFPVDTSEPSDLRKRAYPGIVVAGGIELGNQRLRFLPEIRYTRWPANIAAPGGLLRFNPNQAEFLLGVLF